LHDEPLGKFGRWYKVAEEEEPNLPNACALATADGDGVPSARMVLCKQFDEDGFVFYTNLGSAKCRDINVNPMASLLFHWKSKKRQVRVLGPVEQVEDKVADAYFATRDRTSQLGAWASKQSEPLESRLALEKAVAKYALRFNVGAVPRPEWWSGYRIRPRRIEFWEELPFRLHRRMVYNREEVGWSTIMLYP
jgi:pyridoxamine 5'-phosphate oxidase